MNRLLAAALMAGMPLFAQAAIYKTVDAQGNVSFSDAPSSGAQIVNLPPLPIIPSLSQDQISNALAGSTASKPQRPGRYQVSFTAPSTDQVIRKGEGTIEVSVALKPALFAGDQVQLLLDGKALTMGTEASVATEDLDRGQHLVTARVSSPEGKLLGEASVPVNIQQPVIRPKR